MALVSPAAFRAPRGHSQGAHRHDAREFPPRLADDLAAENPGRCREACVAARERAALGVRPVVAAAMGRPSEPPGERRKRYLDGSLSRVRSRWRREPERQRTKRRPDHHTMANGRRDHLNPLRDVCRPCTGWGQPLERCGGALVALEGRTCSAVKAPGRHGPKAPLAPRIAPREARGAGALNALEAAAAHDEAGPSGGAGAADLQPQIAARRDQARRAAVEGRGHDQRALTAPDRRALPGGAGGPDGETPEARATHVLTATGSVPRARETHPAFSHEFLHSLAGG